MKRFVLEGVFPDLELQGDIWRGWIVPVGGSTPDRHRTGSGAIGSDRFRTGERK